MVLLAGVHGLTGSNSRSFFTLDFISSSGVKLQIFDLCQNAFAIFFTVYVPLYQTSNNVPFDMLLYMSSVTSAKEKREELFSLSFACLVVRV